MVWNQCSPVLSQLNYKNQGCGATAAFYPQIRICSLFFVNPICSVKRINKVSMSRVLKKIFMSTLFRDRKPVTVISWGQIRIRTQFFFSSGSDPVFLHIRIRSILTRIRNPWPSVNTVLVTRTKLHHAMGMAENAHVFVQTYTPQLWFSGKWVCRLNPDNLLNPPSAWFLVNPLNHGLFYRALYAPLTHIESGIKRFLYNTLVV